MCIRDREERHRHRYEINPALIERLEEKGLCFVGRDETGNRCEIFELKDHPYYVGTQYHREYTSKVLGPSKPFLGLIAAAAGVMEPLLEGQFEYKGTADF